MQKQIPEEILKKITEHAKDNGYVIDEMSMYRSIPQVSAFQIPCTILEYLVKPSGQDERIVDIFIPDQDGKPYLYQDFVFPKKK